MEMLLAAFAGWLFGGVIVVVFIVVAELKLRSLEKSVLEERVKVLEEISNELEKTVRDRDVFIKLLILNMNGEFPRLDEFARSISEEK